MRTRQPPNILPAGKSERPSHDRTVIPALAPRALLGIPALPLFVVAALAADSTVTLSIKNDDTQSLRCTVVFAHWVTTDVGPIASGETATVAMTHGPQPGALHIARFDGRPMMIENIICGADKTGAIASTSCR